LANHLTEDFRVKYDKVPWKLVRAMRNHFAHEYDNMDIKRTWTTIEVDIPQLKAYCMKIISAEIETSNKKNG
jgi:uncharacterized protein with HEPN domain